MQIVGDALDKPRNITFKGATDLVTETDKASEDAILKVGSCPVAVLIGHSLVGICSRSKASPGYVNIANCC